MYIKRKVSAGSVSSYLKSKSNSLFNWQLRYKSVCASTESDLSNWLLEKPIFGNKPRAIFAASQKYGIGQRGRIWVSEKGGIWLSAALPCNDLKGTAGLLGLAIAYALCIRLEKSGIYTLIKWPNDLFFLDKKLAGFLPKLIYRGQNLRIARVGLGMNILNRTPPNGISLCEILGGRNINLSEWSAEILIALERAIYILKEEESFYLEAEKKLLKKNIVDPKTCLEWEVDGLDCNGGLKLKRGNIKTIWNRWS